MVKHDFDPIIDEASTVLVLGSFPSVKSRKKSFYYMHANNRFWPVLERLFEDDFTSKDIDKKKALLHKHHIALYDVIEKCEIEGSSDASIEDVLVHPIQDLVEGTKIQRIFLNGRTAESLFNEWFPSLKPMATYLPSTSSANARYRLDDLIQAWQVILK